MKTPIMNRIALAVVEGVLIAMNVTIGFDGTASGNCTGDLQDDASVTVDEILIGVNVALGLTPPNTCAAFDPDGSGSVTVDEILLAVQSALEGCSGPTGPRVVITSPRNGD